SSAVRAECTSTRRTFCMSRTRNPSRYHVITTAGNAAFASAALKTARSSHSFPIRKRASVPSLREPAPPKASQPTRKVMFMALKSPNNVLVLFTKVNTRPPLQPQTAVWHFGWHVTDVRKNLEIYKQRPEVKLLPLYTTDEGGHVFVSSDTWPGTDGVLGLTKAQIAEAKAKGVQPAGG